MQIAVQLYQKNFCGALDRLTRTCSPQRHWRLCTSMALNPLYCSTDSVLHGMRQSVQPGGVDHLCESSLKPRFSYIRTLSLYVSTTANLLYRNTSGAHKVQAQRPIGTRYRCTDSDHLASSTHLSIPQPPMVSTRRPLFHIKHW